MPPTKTTPRGGGPRRCSEACSAPGHSYPLPPAEHHVNAVGKQTVNNPDVMPRHACKKLQRKTHMQHSPFDTMPDLVNITAAAENPGLPLHLHTHSPAHIVTALLHSGAGERASSSSAASRCCARGGRVGRRERCACGGDCRGVFGKRAWWTGTRHYPGLWAGRHVLITILAGFLQQMVCL